MYCRNLVRFTSTNNPDFHNINVIIHFNHVLHILRLPEATKPVTVVIQPPGVTPS